MLGLAIAFSLLAFGFVGGYATRGSISRKRRAQYLAYEPYLGAPRRGQIKQQVNDGIIKLAAAPRLHVVETAARSNDDEPIAK